MERIPVKFLADSFIKESERRLLLFLPDGNKRLSITKLQVQYRIEGPVSNYVKEVKDGKWEFPSFAAYCLICGAKSCAVRLGFYERWFFDGLVKMMIPVIRYRCRKKGKIAAGSHTTFSLLPYQSHPYVRYSSQDCYLIFKESVENSLTQALNRMAAIHEDLSMGTVLRIRRDFQSAANRLVSSGELQIPDGNWKGQLIAFIGPANGSLLLLKHRFYDRNQRFLLGLPSQLR